MNEVLFVEKRERDWQELSRLCDRADASISQLRADELRTFVRLYKAVSADLTRARTFSNNQELIDFLNDLCARAYAILYRPRRRNFLKMVSGGVALAAQVFRRRFAFTLAAFLVFVLSGVFANLLIRYQPEAIALYVPPGFEEAFRQWRDQNKGERSFAESTAMLGFYASNNPLVALRTAGIAAGTFGIGTLQSMYVNGALLGALTYVVEPVGRIPYLYVSILPHGVPELTGIFLAGGAGLLLGFALLRPGQMTRGQSVLIAGKDAIVMTMTAFVLMFIAAPIEAYFSFNPNVPMAAKVIFTVVSIVAWTAFWYGYGRSGEEQSDGPPDWQIAREV